MRHITRSGLAFGFVFIILVGFSAVPAWAQQNLAELASGSHMLPAFRGEMPSTDAVTQEAQARREELSSQEGLLSEDTQVAARLPGPETIAKVAPAAPPRNQYFIEQPPLVTLNEYLRGGYLNKDIKPHGTLLRNQDFWSHITLGETVYVDFGSNKGAKPGDKFLIYMVNDNFKRGFNHEERVRHPVIEESGKENPVHVAKDIWDLESDKEFGVWRRKFDFFEKLITKEGKLIGDMARVVGVLEIIEPGAEIASARVSEMFDLIPRDAYLTPYPANLPKMVTQDYKGPAKNLTGYVLDHSNGYRIGGEKDMVFIDKGTADNVALGDRFVVLAANVEEKLIRRSLINHAEKLWEPEPRTMLDRMVGELVVIATEENSSTAVIVDSSEPIMAGHRIRSKH